MAFTFGDSDFSSIFGTPSPMGASPSMGRLLSHNPEAIIPALIAAGVEPPDNQEPMGPLHSAPPIPMMPGAQAPAEPSTTPSLVPPSVPMAGQPTPGLPAFSTDAVSPYPTGPIENPGGAPPAGKPNYGPMQERIDYVKSLLGGFGLGSPQAGAAPSGPPMAPGANTPTDWYDVPQTEQLAPGVPLPPPRPANLGEAVAGKDGSGSKAAAKPSSASEAAKKLTDALSGVRAPAAPPQPQLRPEVARAGSSGGQGNNLAQLLAILLGGGRSEGGSGPYRLSQAVGGKVV